MFRTGRAERCVRVVVTEGVCCVGVQTMYL
jgi:hypothetical protein